MSTKTYSEAEYRAGLKEVASGWEDRLKRETKSLSDRQAAADQRIAELQKQIGRKGENAFPDQYYNRGYAWEEKVEQARTVGRFLKAIDTMQRWGRFDDAMKELDAIETEHPQWYQVKAMTREEDTNSQFLGGELPRVKKSTPAAFSEASLGAGDYTVPSYWSDYIYNLVPLFGWARKLARVVPMPARTVNLPIGGAVTTSFPGANVAPQLFDASNFFTQSPAVAATMAAAQYLQLEFLQDTSVPILQYLTEQTANAIAREEDRQMFSGTGAPFTGIINVNGVNVLYLGDNQFGGATSVAGTGLNSNITWQDLVNAQFQLNTKALSGACFFGNQRAYSYLRLDKSSTRPTWSFSEPSLMWNQQGISPITGLNMSSPLKGLLWEPMGIPFAVIDSTPDPNGNPVLPDPILAGTAAVILGNLQNVFFGIRQEVTVSVFREQAGNQDLALQRQIALVTWERFAIQNPLPGAFAVLKTDLS